jgi:Uri superfamily endonuclease
MAKKDVLKGTYCLVIHLNQKSRIKVGKMGFIDFKKGYYVYVGSALNSLESRIKRHLSADKKLHWHVDYLLMDKNAEVVDVVFAVSDDRWECSIASEISKNGEGIPKFGCSDCKCPSHLFYFNDLKPGEICSNSFKKLKLEPENLETLKI